LTAGACAGEGKKKDDQRQRVAAFGSYHRANMVRQTGAHLKGGKERQNNQHLESVQIDDNPGRKFEKSEPINQNL